MSESSCLNMSSVVVKYVWDSLGTLGDSLRTPVVLFDAARCDASFGCSSTVPTAPAPDREVEPTHLRHLRHAAGPAAADPRWP